MNLRLSASRIRLSYVFGISYAIKAAGEGTDEDRVEGDPEQAEVVLA